MTYDLSVLIPARNEMFLAKTVENVLENIEANTEVVIVSDGGWPDPPVPVHPRVTLKHHSNAIGQRAATNEAARLSSAKFIMKLDAHCAVDKGFDRKLMENCEYDWTVIPKQYNLHAFDWVCQGCNKRTYQGPTPKQCDNCGSKLIERDIIWKPRESRVTTAWRFDKDLHFQYWGDFKHRVENQGKKLTPTLCCLGACWFLHRERYWELEGMEEKTGSWGQMGVEVACKAWLSGGQLLVNHDTWFAHMFRTQGGDFTFPYPMSGNDQERARKRSREIWTSKPPKWKKAKHDLDWLIEKFKPVPGWHENLTKAVIYYTDARIDPEIAEPVRQQIKRSVNGHQIVSVSLGQLDFGTSLHYEGQRGILTMFKQILAGLEASTADIAFLCEHDVLYHPSHFEFIPPRKDVFYYNENTYKVDSETGQALFYYTSQTSGLCAYRSLLVEHYRKRVAKVEQNARDLIARGEPVKNDGYSRHMGFEPGRHQEPRGVDNYKAESWMSAFPNIDIRHNLNLTPSRWSQDQFRDPNACLGWKLADEVPGWGVTKGRFKEMLQDLRP